MAFTNKRIYYACEAVFLQAVKSMPGGGFQVQGAYEPMNGVQSVGMTTNFNLEKIFNLGQLAQYDTIENNPEVEVTINKIFDGSMPLYIKCIGGGMTSGSLVEWANNRVNMKFGVYDDKSERSVSGSGVSHIEATGLYLQSVNFSFPTDGNATEDVTLVGNHKKYYSTAAGTYSNADVKAHTTVRRWKFNKEACVFPDDMNSDAFTNVTVSVDLNREPVYTLGQFEPYIRTVTFPVEVNTEIETLAQDLDTKELTEVLYSCAGSNVPEDIYHQITFVICGADAGNSFTLDLGAKNRITSISYGGGEAGGGNLTTTFSYTTDNALTVTTAGTYSSVGGTTWPS